MQPVELTLLECKCVNGGIADGPVNSPKIIKASKKEISNFEEALKYLEEEEFELDEFKKMLINSADIKKSNKYGETLLHIACRYDKLEAVEYLLEKGADVEAKTIEGLTPIFYACEFSSKEITISLLTHKASVYSIDNNGDTLLHKVCYWENTDIAKILIDSYQLDVSLKNKLGESALDIANTTQNAKMIAFIKGI